MVAALRNSGVREVTNLLELAGERQGELMKLLAEMVNQDTPSREKNALDRFADYLGQRLSDRGAEITLVRPVEAGNHVVARVGGSEGEKPLLLLAHYDTVWPLGECERRPFRVEDGRAYGPGVFDMKAGLAMILMALDLAAAAGRRLAPLTIIANSDEEIGSLTSRPIIEEEAKKSRAVLVLEPAAPNGALKTSRKGVGAFRLSVKGIPAHAGADPEKGASAILELAHQVIRLHGLTDLAAGISVNAGVVSGGSRVNVIAAEAEAAIDLRVATVAQADWAVAAIRGLQPVLAGTTLEVSGGMNRPPMESTPGNLALFEQTRDLGAELGLALSAAGSGGGSDGNFTSALGIPTLDGLGAVGDGAHAYHEYVEVHRLPGRVALLARLLEKL
ncbi:MAG: M20 family metallopeptidase [Bacillota bacterium]